METVKLIECPRDAWQGLPQVIPADEKAAYHRALIAADFRHIDAGSFVSPRYVPQMADREDVMRSLLTSLPQTSLSPEIIGIAVNEKGLERALASTGVTTIGYPYSISAYFRRANANMTRSESCALVEKIQRATSAAGRDVVVYISMAFGNPYDEPWGLEIVVETMEWLKSLGVRTVSLADTAGTAKPKEVGNLFRAVAGFATGMEIGVHLHSRTESAAEKVLAAYEAGCRRFDSALTGLGGCPFASDQLVGNIPTEIVVPTLAQRGADTGIRADALTSAIAMSREIAQKYARAAVVH